MTILLFSVLLTLCPIVSSVPIHPEDRVVNGDPISAHVYPWMVSLRMDVHKNETHVYEGYGSFCGGSLIGLFPPIIVTAAHCLFGFTYDPTNGYISSNTTDGDIALYADINRTYPDYNVEHSFSTLSLNVSMFIIHPQYIDADLVNDIALIVVKDHNETMEPLPPITSELPIIPDQLSIDEGCCVADETFTAIGYGRDSTYGAGTFSLEATEMSYMGERQCWRELHIIPEDVTDIEAYVDDWFVAEHEIICVVGDNTDICSGDSGGPLIRTTEYETQVIGVTSYTIGECNDGMHSAYTSTAHYHDWIYDAINEHLGITYAPTTQSPTAAPVTPVPTQPTAAPVTTTTVLASDTTRRPIGGGNAATRNELFCCFAMFVSVMVALLM